MLYVKNMVNKKYFYFSFPDFRKIKKKILCIKKKFLNSKNINS